MTCLFDDNGNIIGVEYDAAPLLEKEAQYENPEVPVAEKEAVLDEEICA